MFLAEKIRDSSLRSRMTRTAFRRSLQKNERAQGSAKLSDLKTIPAEI
jgi:hypothetical protein